MYGSPIRPIRPDKSLTGVDMRTAVRLVVVCLGCYLAGLAIAPVVTFGEGGPFEGSRFVESSGGSSVLDGPLMIAGSPTEGEELRAGSEAKRYSPETFAVREQSRTKYEGLGAQAARVDRSIFPGLIERQAGGTPRLPKGDSYDIAVRRRQSLIFPVASMVRLNRPLRSPNRKWMGVLRLWNSSSNGRARSIGPRHRSLQ
jgi:hypothetical protein